MSTVLKLLPKTAYQCFLTLIAAYVVGTSAGLVARWYGYTTASILLTFLPFQIGMLLITPALAGRTSKKVANDLASALALWFPLPLAIATSLVGMALGCAEGLINGERIVRVGAASLYFVVLILAIIITAHYLRSAVDLPTPLLPYVAATWTVQLIAVPTLIYIL